MQHMPDRDFDNLFRDKFTDAEVEPSGHLWTNIAEKLTPVPKKRNFPIMWMAAASIAVVFSVSLLLPEADDKIYLQANPKLVNTKIAESLPVAQGATQSVTRAEAVLKSVKAGPQKPLLAHQSTKKVVAPVTEEKNIFMAMQPVTTNEHLPNKKADAKPLEVVHPQIEVLEDATVYMANHVSETTDNAYDDADANNQKKGIRNMGDLINYVVDKVDKRENKLIKFSTDDDDNSSVVGINIGFLKLNKRNK